RGDYSLITVPLAAGTKTVELSFRSQLYNRGRALTLGSLGLLAIAAAGSLASARRPRACASASRHPHLLRGGEPPQPRTAGARPARTPRAPCGGRQLSGRARPGGGATVGAG